MAQPSEEWDETSPAGNSDLNLGDNRIRQLKTQLREVISVDHEMDSSGSGDDWGKHNQVSLIEQADIGSGEEGYTFAGAQTVAGKPEFVYTDEDDNDIQITKAGKLNAGALGSLADVSPVGNDAFPALVLKAIYPVGTVYTNYSDSTNPGTLFGFGTWIPIAGRVVIGLDATQTEFDTAGETGGAKTVDLSHIHTGTTDGAEAGGAGGVTFNNNVTQHVHPFTTDSSGSSTQSVMNPYVVCYVWYRSA